MFSGIVRVCILSCGGANFYGYCRPLPISGVSFYQLADAVSGRGSLSPFSQRVSCLGTDGGIRALQPSYLWKRQRDG